jgi:hypothetical protein
MPLAPRTLRRLAAPRASSIRSEWPCPVLRREASRLRPRRPSVHVLPSRAMLPRPAVADASEYVRALDRAVMRVDLFDTA